jgi:hypothetical protein
VLSLQLRALPKQCLAINKNLLLGTVQWQEVKFLSKFVAMRTAHDKNLLLAMLKPQPFFISFTAFLFSSLTMNMHVTCFPTAQPHL